MSTQSTRPLRAANSRSSRVLDSSDKINSIADTLPDFDRIPQFHSSECDFDTFLNEYFQRQLFENEHATATRCACSQQSGVDLLNAFEGDSWSLCWQDRTAMGLKFDFIRRLPTIGSYVPQDTVLHALLRLPVDGFGHVWNTQLQPSILPSVCQYRSKYSWPWYDLTSYSPADSPRTSLLNGLLPAAQWTCSDLDAVIEAGKVTGNVTGPLPRMVSPDFAQPAGDMPVLEIVIRFKQTETRDGLRLLNGFRLFWATASQPEFREDNSVGVDDCSLSPLEYAAALKPDQIPMEPQFRLQFQMQSRHGWRDETITRFMVIPAGMDAVGGNAVGTCLDVDDICIIKHASNPKANADFINVSARLYAWSGDDGFLQAMMPKLRRAMLGLTLHAAMNGNPLLLSPTSDSQTEMICDTQTNVAYCNALCHMALLEKAVTEHRLPMSRGQQILSPARKPVSYDETSYSLESQAKAVRLAIQTHLWNPATLRFCNGITKSGTMLEDGSIALNLKALAYCVCTQAQRDCVLSWLDELTVDGYQNPGTVMFEQMARTHSYKQKQVDRSYERIQQLQKSGQTHSNSEQNQQETSDQSDYTPELPMGSLHPLYAFLGIDVRDPDVLSIAPTIPTQLHHVSVQNVFFHGNYINIEAGKDYVSLEGSRLNSTKGLKLKVVFHNIRYTYHVFVNDNEYNSYKTGNDGTVQIPLSLGAAVVQIRPD